MEGIMMTVWILALIGYILQHIGVFVTKKSPRISAMLDVIFIVLTWQLSVAWAIVAIVYSSIVFLGLVVINAKDN